MCLKIVVNRPPLCKGKARFGTEGNGSARGWKVGEGGRGER